MNTSLNLCHELRCEGTLCLDAYEQVATARMGSKMEQVAKSLRCRRWVYPVIS
ncbi:MAG: hypothetical protein PUB84_07655 [Bacteroidales bacterium]|nr:hypothetical protein [Bacteroidales bacterium]MDD6554106.1 hypothetical protein [Bacteroidales bacterium]